jgi:DNA-binding HxlR family transcriptional regulator
MIGKEEIGWLTGSRWFVPVLALASREEGARFAVVAARLGISGSMLSRTLEQLLRKGWLVRNPGYGHPLRPEYVLSEAGRAVGAWCEGVMAQRERLCLATGSLTRWSLPVVLRLDRRWERFSTLQADLRPISPRSLSLTLKKLLGAQLMERRVEDSFPPTSLYGLTMRGQRLAAAMR